MGLYEALYIRKCRIPVCWIELSGSKLLGLDLIKETKEKINLIRGRLKVAFDRQKSYTDIKGKDIEYTVGEKVFLKVLKRYSDFLFKKIYDSILTRGEGKILF